MKMVRADVHLILLKATHLLWLVSSDFEYFITTCKKCLVLSSVIHQFLSIKVVDCVHIFYCVLR